VRELHPTAELQTVLHETLAQHSVCFNAACAEGFPAQISNGVDLHDRAHSPLRPAYSNLPAQLICSSPVKTPAAVRSALTWQTKRERAYPRIVAKARTRGRPAPAFTLVRTPRSAARPIHSDQRFYGVRLAQMRASLATVARHVELPFPVPHHSVRYLSGMPTWHARLGSPMLP